jgi:predicted nucleic acid-binding protein
MREERTLMDTVYIETSVISHATAWPSSDPAIAVLQEQARRWMNEQRPLYEIVTSQLVIDEAAMGDSAAAARRLQMLDGIPVLPANPDADLVADEIVRRSMMPANARIDALHVALAALAGVQYLLTQNCKHIANAHELPRLYRLLEELGLSGMLICTPIEFLGGTNNDP